MAALPEDRFNRRDLDVRLLSAEDVGRRAAERGIGTVLRYR
jgi:hypothetical protein